jgi:flagellar motility protein MotE (MotC chaperone)
VKMPRVQIRFIPLAVAMAAIAFGAHAAEAVKSATGHAAPAKTQAEKAPVVKAQSPQSRAEVRFGEELQAGIARPDDKARQVELRERLAEAAERRIDGKLNELRAREAAQTQAEANRNEEVNKQLGSLVKVYETMKPKDAARIFEKLDMPVQIAVASRMKEAKMASILSQMSADGARALTMELAQRANIDRRL